MSGRKDRDDEYEAGLLEAKELSENARRFAESFVRDLGRARIARDAAPGIEATLHARVTNPYGFAIRVTSTGVSVGDASAACPASILSFSDSHAAVDLAPATTVSVPLAVRMARDAPDACQGATWPLTFTGFALGPDQTELPETSILHPRTLPVVLVMGVMLAWLALLVSARRAHRTWRML